MIEDKHELKRQSFHISFGLLLLVLSFINTNLLFIVCFIGILLCILESFNIKTPLFNFFLNFLERGNEKKGLRGKGFFFYCIGTILAFYFFKIDFARASLMILAFGDSFSRLLGPYGNIRHPFDNTKFIEGVVYGGFIAIILAMIFVDFAFAMPASIVSMTIEGLNIKIKGFKIDDNLMIPVASGITMILVSLIGSLII
ncbi:MAG: hypothetical protein ACQER9_00495 [Nanobdellota archaeon]